MKKQIEKFKVRIDQNLNRTEKSVALSPDLTKVEETIGIYKQACSALQKKLSEDLQGYGKGTDGSSIDRRLKKTGDFVLGNIFSEVGRNLHKQNPNSCLGNVLTYLGELFPQLANSHVNYEICVEQMIIAKLQDVLNIDLPKIKSSRGQLDKLLLELDTTKARLEKAREEELQHAGPAATTKIEKLNEELDDTLRNVDQARDGLAADMLSFLSRDNEIAGLLSNYIDYRLQLQQENCQRLEEAKPRLDTLRALRKGFPIFGTPLQDHIRDLGLESGIAFPIQLCCTKLLELGLDEEGLFRLTAGASKVKRLRAEIEAGHAYQSTVDGYDHHVFTGLIKTYLRELPSPLLGEELYSGWLEAGQLTGEDRFNAIWNLLQSDYLPRENYRNIQYLFKFLHEVTQHSDKNKMSANNLAIVITPNVIWSNTAVQDAMDVGAGGVLQQVVELIISQHAWFFQNDPPVAWQAHFAPLKTCLPFSVDTAANSGMDLRSLPDLPPPASSSAVSSANSSVVTASGTGGTVAGLLGQTLSREKSRKVKKTAAAVPPSYSPNNNSLSTSSSSNSTSGNAMPPPHSPPSSPSLVVQYRHHNNSSPSTAISGGSTTPRRSSDSFNKGAIQHPSHPPPKPPPSNSGVRASLDLRSQTTPTTSMRPRAMTSAAAAGGGESSALSAGNRMDLSNRSSTNTSPEKLMCQTKDLMNIGTRLLVAVDSPPGEDNSQHLQHLDTTKTTTTTNQELHNLPKSADYHQQQHHPTFPQHHQHSSQVNSKKEGSGGGGGSSPSSYPVPAPRSMKPAVPTKPEGLSSSSASSTPSSSSNNTTVSSMSSIGKDAVNNTSSTSSTSSSGSGSFSGNINSGTKVNGVYPSLESAMLMESATKDFTKL
eukprot:TRINITY_DN1948_c0_g1_i17.p1 TRINITY_DN1948_c0_g1~~TRINITY_DN1948_c0_g1_i17.p1  ORF type:complete len:878 (+),score=255.73 TRINITY_DN1948_c0_g1_i17:200-2833(+)